MLMCIVLCIIDVCYVGWLASWINVIQKVFLLQKYGGWPCDLLQDA